MSEPTDTDVAAARALIGCLGMPDLADALRRFADLVEESS